MLGGRTARVAVFGATGALGREVVAVLEERAFPVRELALVGSDGSLGEEIEFRGDTLSVAAELPPLRGQDLVIGCAPGAASLELVRLALRAEVSCIDCSGALAGSRDVPLLVSDLCSPAAVLGAPVIATPPRPSVSGSTSASDFSFSSILRENFAFFASGDPTRETAPIPSSQKNSGGISRLATLNLKFQE